MKILLKSLAILVLATCCIAARAAAQGPAGVGAAEAAGGSSTKSRSYNPTKWFAKKDSKSAAANNLSVEELDRKLEPKLRRAEVLAASAALKEACKNFIERVDCVAALRASHNLGINFDCVKSNMTGVRTDVDTSACRMPSGDKPLSLMKTIRLLKPDVDAKNAAKDAETDAREDVADAAS